MLEIYLLTLIGVAAAQASPGPNLIAVASAALSQGRVPALYVTLGVSSGMLIWAVAVAFGLGTLFSQYPWSLALLKLLGGGYLLWLAVNALFSVSKGNKTLISSDTPPHSYLTCWRHGVVVVLTNPKAGLMWSAVATFLFGSNLTTWQVALFGPIGATSGFLIYGFYAMLFSTASANSIYNRFSKWIQAIFGLSFGALGGTLMADGVRAIRE